MSLHAREFFADLALPFTDSYIVGNTYYATPDPGGPLRLRIDFAPTIRADEYNGLRLAAVHPERGELDATVLRFDDHHTFDHRDATQGRSPGTAGHGKIREFRDRPDIVPWRGAHTSGLRNAIEHYSAVWFPGAWKALARARTAGRTARKTPAPPATRRTGRAH